MKYRNWQIPYTAPQPPEALLRAGYSPLLAVLLALRGYADPVQARAFLSGGDQSAFDPMLLQDMDKAVARIRTAIERRENVAVFGDYDVDGITSTCVLTDYLRRQGVPVHPYIPDRIEEGYGLNMDAITNLQRTSDITLIITVDCGITAIDETNYALQRGIDMVITDHHECSGQAIPNAVAVVDPKRPGSQYPNSGLAGVGVAYKLLCALEDGSDRVLREYGDLVAIGTVADVMPLTGENRYLVAQGLAQINARPRPGIRALLHECGAEGRPVTATTIGFTLAPRINAAGRLGKTAVAALLLLTNDDGEADRYAAGLCQLNRERQALEQQIWEEASAIACRYPPRMPLVLASDSWHQGVIGIAASRLSEEFHLPQLRRLQPVQCPERLLGVSRGLRRPRAGSRADDPAREHRPLPPRARRVLPPEPGRRPAGAHVRPARERSAPADHAVHRVARRARTVRQRQPQAPAVHHGRTARQRRAHRRRPPPAAAFCQGRV